MRLIVLNCLLLASVAVALPNGRHKRHLSYLKKLVSSAIGGTQINIEPPKLQKENAYKLFQLPGYDDVMIKVAPKKPVVEEFVYPAAQPVNINAFGKVVGTKSTDDTLVAVKDVDNLLKTGILHEGYNNVMKETIAPMFPILNTANNYVVQENIKAGPVIETRPIITKVTETRPVITEVRENRPVFTEVRETRPVLTEVIENRPVFTEVREPRPVFTEVRENIPVFTEVRENRPVFAEVREPRPVFTEVRENRPVFTEVRESIPVFTEARDNRPVFTEARENRPVFTEIRENRPVFAEVREPRPVFTEVRENRPVFTEVRENIPVFTEARENRPVFTEVRENRPVFTEVRENIPVFTKVRESRPVFTEIKESRPVFTEVRENRPVFTEVTETKPVLTEVIETRPFEEKVELKVEPSYSYKQIQNNEAVMTFTGYNSPGVEVMESLKMKTELPMCIKKRVEEAIVLGADPQRFTPVQEVVQYQTPPVVDFSYPRVQPYVQNSYRGEVLTEGFRTVADFGLPPQRFRPIQDSPVRYDLRPTKIQAINPHPLPLHSHKSLHVEENISASKDKVNPQTKKIPAFTNMGDKVDISQTLGPLPPQYIRHVSNKGENAAESNKKVPQQMKVVPIASSKDSVFNAHIPNNVYKFQSNPNTGKVVNASNDLRTNMKTIPNHYVPAVIRETPKKDTVQVKNVVYTNKVAAKPQKVPSPAAPAGSNAAKLNLLRENVQPSFKNNPIVLEAVKDYSYQQKNADGSSLNVKGSKHGVSVDVKQKKNVGRGDIPDQ